LTTGGTILTRTAVALIDIEITVASQAWRVWLEMRCHQATAFAIALLYIALSCKLTDEAVLTHAVGEASHTGALVCIK
jgi:hypothetical protein